MDVIRHKLLNLLQNQELVMRTDLMVSTQLTMVMQQLVEDSPDQQIHLLKELAENNYQTLKYTNSLSPKFARMASIQQEEGISIQVIRMLLSMAYNAGQDEVAKEITQKVESIYNPVLLQPDRQPAQPAGDSAQPAQEK